MRRQHRPLPKPFITSKQEYTEICCNSSSVKSSLEKGAFCWKGGYLQPWLTAPRLLRLGPTCWLCPPPPHSACLVCTLGQRGGGERERANLYGMERELVRVHCRGRCRVISVGCKTVARRCIHTVGWWTAERGRICARHGTLLTNYRAMMARVAVTDCRFCIHNRVICHPHCCNAAQPPEPTGWSTPSTSSECDRSTRTTGRR
jgi:hypothetical protein